MPKPRTIIVLENSKYFKKKFINNSGIEILNGINHNCWKIGAKISDGEFTNERSLEI